MCGGIGENIFGWGDNFYEKFLRGSASKRTPPHPLLPPCKSISVREYYIAYGIFIWYPISPTAYIGHYPTAIMFQLLIHL
jgi:hypothetical protein